MDDSVVFDRLTCEITGNLVIHTPDAAGPSDQYARGLEKTLTLISNLEALQLTYNNILAWQV